MASKLSSFLQRMCTCTGWITSPQKETIFIKLDRISHLLKYMLQFLPGKDISSYLKSHKVNIRLMSPEGMMALRYILKSQMEGKLGFATSVRIDQFQKVNIGKPFPLNPQIFNLDICNCGITPTQLGAILDSCPNVTNLRISGCPNIKEVNFLNGRNNLRYLTLSRCERLRDVSPISSLTDLIYLNLEESYSLVDVQFLEPLVHLRVLNLACCWMVRNFRSLGMLIHVFSLNLYQCHISDVQPITGLINLRVVYHDSNFDVRPFKDHPIRFIKLGRR